MKKSLDACCGSRMFWFDKENKDVIFMDNRELTDTLCDGRILEIRPDVAADFRNMPFDDESFTLVVFDPPHFFRNGEKSWIGKKYGTLDRDTWREDLKAGFSECFRVLQTEGILIFKWNETDIPLREILALTNQKPLFGHRSGKQMKTHWVTFMRR